MVQLLKRQLREISCSIYKKMLFCFGVVLLISMSVSTMVFYNGKQVANKYETSMNQLLVLNEVYTELETVNNSVSGFSQTYGSEDHLRIQQGIDKLTQALESLEKIRINSDYERASKDLVMMVESYLEQVEQVIKATKNYAEDPQKPNAANQRNQCYAYSQRIYRIIGKNFKGVYSFLLIEAENFQKDVKHYRLMSSMINAGIIIISTLLSIILAKNFSESIVKPIKELTYYAERISAGQIRPETIKTDELSVETTDEISTLMIFFKEMLDKIKQQILQIEENAKTVQLLHDAEMENLRISNLLKTSELKAYQARINPHFLFNTLNMISQEAYLEGAGDIANSLDITASLLRYSLNSMSKQVTLRDELENIGDYVFLQEQRFGKRIKFIFELDEAINNLKMPCLILQPLVENAIKHGVGSYVEGGEIRVTTAYRDSYGIISVTDNGIGISEKKLEEIREDLYNEEDSNLEIGLKNVVQRMRLLYGEAFKLTINSIEHEKTEILLFIPYIREA